MTLITPDYGIVFELEKYKTGANVHDVKNKQLTYLWSIENLNAAIRENSPMFEDCRREYETAVKDTQEYLRVLRGIRFNSGLT